MDKEKIKKFIALPTDEKVQKLKGKLYKKSKFKVDKDKYIPSGYNNKSKFMYEGPKVSVLMPIYNHADVALKSINSVLNQTYKNIELIILDDGSKDNLLEILKPYYNLENVRIYSQKNQKLPRALTHLHQLATGDFITWTSADNAMHKKMIELLVKELIKHPEASLVYGDVSVIGANDRPYYGPCRDFERDRKKPKIIRLLRNQKPLDIGNDNYINASFLYRKINSDALLGIYGDDIIGAEDYDYWLRLKKSGDLVHVCLEKPYYFYRVHDNSMSHELETKKIKEHQSRLENLKNYEQERIKWCKTRPTITFDKSINKDKAEYLNEIWSNLPVNICDKEKTKKEIYFTEKNVNKDIYVKFIKNNYILTNNKLHKDILKIFVGIDVPRNAYKARNLYSHSYYSEYLSNFKGPIFGCHIDSADIEINEVEKTIKNNKDINFAIFDIRENKKLNKLAEENANLRYIKNSPFGEDYRSYSHFSRVIAFKSSNEDNKYRNVLLAYAIGRKISYSIDSFYEQFPYTIPYSDTIKFTKTDGITNFDYDLMTKYLEEYSLIGRAKRLMDLYNAHTQELYIKRPNYVVSTIPEESTPYRIN